MEIVVGKEATHWLETSTLECYLGEKERFILLTVQKFEVYVL